MPTHHVPQPAPKHSHKRGARRSPMHRVLQAPRLLPLGIPTPVAYVPRRLNIWGNDVYGDCVTAEEAFAKACYDPEIYLDPQVVIAWAKKHDVLEGSDLVTVLQAMQHDGFLLGQQQYDDGPGSVVDYSHEVTLQTGISLGPVKIAIDGDALPQDAGAKQGWHAVGGRPGQFPNTDHCVSLCGWGETAWLYQQLGVPLPQGLPPMGYLLYTWATIGFVDFAWLLSTCAEAWVRNPTTLGVPPLPLPSPPNPPTPGPTPTPTPTPKPTPPVPVPDPRALVDGLFEFLQSMAQGNTVLLECLRLANALLDSWLATSPKLPPLGKYPLVTLCYQGFPHVISQHPRLHPALQKARSYVSHYLSLHPQ